MKYINGIPVIWNEEEGRKMLGGSLFTDLYQSTQLNKIRTKPGSPAYQSPFGDDSLFNDKGYVEFVNFKTLLADIKSLKGKPLQYDYKKYESMATIKWVDHIGPLPPERVYKEDGWEGWGDWKETIDYLDLLPLVELPGSRVNVNYETPNGKQLLFTGKLNVRPGIVPVNARFINFTFELDPKKDLLRYSDEFYYTDKDQLPAGQKAAIVISTRYFEEYLSLCEIENSRLGGHGLDMISNKFFQQLATYKDEPDSLAWLYRWMPDFIFNQLDTTAMFEHLKTMLLGPLKGTGLQQEVTALRILARRLTGKQKDHDDLLGFLASMHSNNKTMFELLFQKMDDGDDGNNFFAFILLTYKAWLLSSYKNPQHRLYKYENQPVTLPYNSDKILGFYKSGYEFSFNCDTVEVQGTASSTKGLLDDFFEVFDESYLNKPAPFVYHLFQPISLPEVNQAGEIKLPDTTVPAFYLMAFDKKNAWANFEKAKWLGVDIALTCLAIGNIAKLRYLTYLSRGAMTARKISAYYFLTSSLLHTLLNFVNNCEEGSFCQTLRRYLFWVDVAMLGADVVTEQLLKKTAREAVEALDATRMRVPEEIVEHLEEVGDVARVSAKRGQFQEFIKRNYYYTIEHITREVIIKNLVGHTRMSNKVAKYLESGEISYLILPSNEFEAFLRSRGVKENIQHYSAATYENIMYFRKEAFIEDFMSCIVHEGSHAIDYVNGVRYDFAAERNAFFYERQFQKAVGLEVEYETIETMINYIKIAYKDLL
jgi:hypothetical protein